MKVFKYFYPFKRVTIFLNMDTQKNKRGRKPKLVANNDKNESIIALNSEENDQTKQKSRRGRKPKAVYNTFDTPTDFFQSNSDDENIIMRLNVSQKDDSSIIDDVDLLPDAYNSNHMDTFLSKPCEIEFEKQQSDFSNIVDIPLVNESYDALKVVELLKDFEEKNKNNEWPSTTSIHCYWCCHRFESAPFGIPIKYTESKFHVFGCFCSLECAAAYNFSSKESIDEIWERYNLINLLSRKIEYKNIVKPAPNRLALKMFGGHLDINEYREYCNTAKVININFPPMMSLTQQIEEINESDINNDYKYIPIDTERINKYKEKIKLKRSKPLTNFENTLDHVMNLKFGC